MNDSTRPPAPHAQLIYRRTGNLRAGQLLGHTKIEIQCPDRNTEGNVERGEDRQGLRFHLETAEVVGPTPAENVDVVFGFERQQEVSRWGHIRPKGL